VKSNNLQLNHRNYIIYKFFNSLFLGTSIGSVFIIYSPLEPAIYSIGGIVLALGLMGVALFYEKILNIGYFYIISLFVEIVILAVLISFLIFSYSYEIALCVYIGYQVTFIFGSYLGRVETLLLKKKRILKAVDISKQAGYMIGLLLSYVVFLFIGIKASDLNDKKLQLTPSQAEQILVDENKLPIGFKVNFEEENPTLKNKFISEETQSKIKSIISKNQVYYLHYVLVFIEILVIVFIIKSFVYSNKE
tara:strand:+ start:601 stop:1347 length:747 start_codon:yes stop_codon:yes gene_type:complete